MGRDIGHKTFKTGNTVNIGIDLEPRELICFRPGNKQDMSLWGHSAKPLEIEKAGVRRISVWAREAGTIYGKLLVSPKSPNQYKPSNQMSMPIGGMVSGPGPDEGPLVVAGKRELSEDASISEKLDEGDDDAMEDFFGLDD